MKQDIGLVIDWETTGLLDQEVPWLSYLEGPQGVEIGAILVSLPTFQPIAEFHSRIAFLGTANGIAYGGPAHEKLTWSSEAEKIHGLSVSDLRTAQTPSVVASNFVNFIKTNAAIDDPNKHPIMICGHNPSGDLYCTKQMLYLGNMERKIRFHHRMLDSFCAGYLVLGTNSSDELFERTSGIKRTLHSAIEDARLTLHAFQRIYEICRTLN